MIVLWGRKQHNFRAGLVVGRTQEFPQILHYEGGEISFMSKGGYKKSPYVKQFLNAILGELPRKEIGEFVLKRNDAVGGITLITKEREALDVEGKGASVEDRMKMREKVAATKFAPITDEELGDAFGETNTAGQD